MRGCEWLQLMRQAGSRHVGGRLQHSFQHPVPPSLPSPPPPSIHPPTRPCQARVSQSQRIQDMNVAQAKRQAADLAKAAAAAEWEGRAAEARLAAVGAELAAAQVRGCARHLAN